MYRNNPDEEVIISDWMMPNMDGLELCKRVRGLEREGYAFFIFLTALGGREHLLGGMQAGADEYLTKPLDGEQLRVKLDEASRVASLQRDMKVENGAGMARGDGDGGGEPGVGLPALRRSVMPRAGGTAWDILVYEGKLTEGQLQQALESQKDNPMELGKALVSLGFISEVDLAQAQARRLNLDYVELAEADVDGEAVSSISERLLRRHRALPLRREDERLVVAMSDPTDV